MYIGKAPFQGPNRKVTQDKICKDKLKLPSYLTNDCKHLLKGLLNRSVKKRLAVDKIKKHQFFRGVNWDKVAKKQLIPPHKPQVNHPDNPNSPNNPNNPPEYPS